MDSIINADAIDSGDGGKVIIWSDEVTRFYGNISARGGAEGGDGGFAEVSGKQNLDFGGSVNLAADNGNPGTLLLDPDDINVVTGGTDGAAGGNILFATAPPASWTVDPAALDAVAGNILLQANNDITVTNAINLTTNGATLDMNAGDDILVNANITTNDGAITLIANHPGGTQANTGTFGVVTMADGTTINAGDQNIQISSQGHATIETLTTTGNVGVQSTQGSILAASDTGDSITGVGVSLGASPGAGQSVGTSANPINTTATQLDGRAGTGGFYIIEGSDVLIDDIAITGAGDVSIIATGAITAGAEGTAEITTTGNVTLQGTSIGAANNAVEFTGGGSGILDLTATAGLIDIIELTTDSFDTFDFTVTNANVAHSIVLNSGSIAFTGDGTNISIAGSAVDTTARTDDASFALNVSDGGIVLANDSIDTGTGNVTLTGTGSITTTGAEGTAEITSTGNVALQGTSIGAAGNAVEFTGGGSGILDLTATSGLIDIDELTSDSFDTFDLNVTNANVAHSILLNTGTITLSGDGADITIGAGGVALDGRATDASFALEVSDGGIILTDNATPAIDVGTANVTLTSADDITSTGEANTQISNTGNITLSSVNGVGAAASAITFGEAGGSGSLSVTNSTSGAIDMIEQAGAMTSFTFEVSNAAASHNLDLQGDGAGAIAFAGDATDVDIAASGVGLTGKSFQLTVTNSAITLQNGSIGTGSGNVTLIASGAVATGGTEGTAEITSTGNVTLQGTAIGAANNAIEFTGGGAGILDLTATSGLIDVIELTSDSFDTFNFTVTNANVAHSIVLNTGAIAFTGDGTNISIAGSAVDTTARDPDASFALTVSDGGIALAADAIDTGTATVSLTASSGSITDSGDNATANITTTGGAGNLTLSASGDIGESGDAIDVAIANANLNLSSTGSDIFINSADSLTINSLTTGTGDDIVQISTTGAADLTFDGTGGYTNVDTDAFDLDVATGTLTFQTTALTVGSFDIDTAGGAADQGDVVVNVALATSDVAEAIQTQVSGGITITGSASGGSLTGSGSLTTGDVTSNGAEADQTATSGSISVDIGEELTGVSLATGSATMSGADGSDTTQVGSITLDAESIGTDGSPVTVTLGAATGGDTDNTGALNVETTGGAGAGGAFITSATALNIGDLATASNTDANEFNLITTGGNALTFDTAAIYTNLGGVTLDVDTTGGAGGTVTFNTAFSGGTAVLAAIDVDATDAVTANVALSTVGADNAAGSGFAGGDVDINSSGGTVIVGAIDTSGGDSTGGDGDGGNAGTIDLTGTSITLRGDLTARGGALNGAGTNDGAGGAITFNDPVLLDAATVTMNTLTGGTGAGTGTDGTIDFNDTLNSATGTIRNLTLVAGAEGDIFFDANVGAVDRLGALQVTSADVVTQADGFTLAAQSLTQLAGTTSTTFGGAVTIGIANGAGGAVDIDTAGTVEFKAALSTVGADNAAGNGFAGGDVDINSSGGTVIVGAIDTSGGDSTGGDGDGGNAGTIDLTGTSITLRGDLTARGGALNGAGTNDGAGGDITFNDPVVLLANRTITTGATAGNISFDDTLDATTAFTETLTLTAGTGDITFTGLVGDTAELGTVQINQAATVNVDNTFSVASLDADGGNITTFDSTGVLIDTTGDADTVGGAVLISTTTGNLDTGGITTIGGAASADSAGQNAGAVTLVSASGDISVGGTITATGSAGNDVGDDDVGYAGGIGGAVGITANDGTVAVAAITTTGGAGSAVDATEAGANGGTAGTIALTSTNNDTTLNGNLSAIGGAAGTGGTQGAGASIDLNSAVLLGASIAISTGATAGNISFDDTLDATTAFTETLTLTAGTGDITFTGLVGDTAELGTVQINQAATVNVDNTFSVASLDADGGNITTFDSNGFTIDTTGANNANGGAVQITTNNALTAGPIVTTGGTDQSDTQGRNAGLVALNAGTILTTDTITATGSAAATPGANPGGTGGAVTLTAGTRIDLGGDIDTSAGAGTGTPTGGTVTFNDPVVLLANRTITTGATAGNISFDDTLDATTAFTETLGLTAGTGDITFTGLVGDTAELGTITISSANNVTANGVRATSFVQTDGTGLTTLNLGNFNTGTDRALTTTGAINITTNDLEINDLINSGTSVAITDSDGDGIGLGGSVGGGLNISNVELQRITANGLTLTTGGGNIQVNGISADNSNNIAGTTFLNAAGSINFIGSESTFNALDARADNRISVNFDVTTDTGNLAMDGNANNDADINDNILIVDGVTLTSAGSITLDATTGGIDGDGTLTLNAAEGVTLNDSLTTAGTTTIDADTDADDNTGTLTVAAGATLSTGGNTLAITANTVEITGAIDSGAAATTITDSDGTGIGLGDATVTDGLNITGAELENITATGLTLTTAGNITVDNILAANSNNISGTTTLTANGATSTVTFEDDVSIFNTLAVNASDGVTAEVGIETDAGELTIAANTDGDGTGSVDLDGAINAAGAFSSAGINFINDGAPITATGIVLAHSGTVTLVDTLNAGGGIANLGGGGTYVGTGTVIAGTANINANTIGLDSADGPLLDVSNLVITLTGKVGSRSGLMTANTGSLNANNIFVDPNTPGTVQVKDFGIIFNPSGQSLDSFTALATFIVALEELEKILAASSQARFFQEEPLDINIRLEEIEELLDEALGLENSRPGEIGLHLRSDSGLLDILNARPQEHSIRGSRMPTLLAPGSGDETLLGDQQDHPLNLGMTHTGGSLDTSLAALSR